MSLMHTSQSQRKILLLESPPSGSESMSLSSAVSDLLWAITTSFSTVPLQVDSKPLLPFAPSLWALPPSTLGIQSRADSSPVHTNGQGTLNMASQLGNGLFSWFILSSCLFRVLGIEPGSLSMLSTGSTTELKPQL